MADSITGHISRRRLLRLVASSLLLVSGCSTFRSSSDLEAARDDLQRLLDEFADGEAEEVQLLAIGRRIGMRADELVAEHKTFIRNFNELSANRNVPSQGLTSIVADYEERRIWLRNDLLRLQDDLKAALPAEEWERTLAVLNRAGTAVARRAKAGG